MKNDTTPGEWQTEVNAYGGVRRYRMIGNCKEYEMMVTVDGISIPESEVSAYHERKRAAEQARMEAEKNRPTPPPPKQCPFVQALDTTCKREKCALFDGKGCTLAPAATAARDTAGLRCPFTSTACRVDCMLYMGGCTLTAAERKNHE